MKKIQYLMIIVFCVCNVFAQPSDSQTVKIAKVHRNNYGDRGGVTPTILHIIYTGESLQDALKTFKNPKEEVSVHYLISEEGVIYRLVPESHNAFHAGQSHWGGVESINSHSIGVALINLGISDTAAKQYGWKNNFPPYPKAQMDALILLSKDIIKRWKIKPWNIVGHSDVAPQRKFDPGLAFPWAYLAENSVGFWPKRVMDCSQCRINNLNFFKDLAYYGYHVSDNIMDNENVISAFQAHFRPSNVNGMIDTETQCILNELLKMKKEYVQEVQK